MCYCVWHSFISIHASRERGDSFFRSRKPSGSISIHASRERGDCALWLVGGYDDISIHASRERGDSTLYGSSSSHFIFQSTPPAREATRLPCNRTLRTINFNPRLPRERRRGKANPGLGTIKFQSTPPAREATASPIILSAFHL